MEDSDEVRQSHIETQLKEINQLLLEVGLPSEVVQASIGEQVAWLLFDRARLLDEVEIVRHSSSQSLNASSSSSSTMTTANVGGDVMKQEKYQRPSLKLDCLKNDLSAEREQLMPLVIERVQSTDDAPPSLSLSSGRVRIPSPHSRSHSADVLQIPSAPQEATSSPRRHSAESSVSHSTDPSSPCRRHQCIQLHRRLRETSEEVVNTRKYFTSELASVTQKLMSRERQLAQARQHVELVERRIRDMGEGKLSHLNQMTEVEEELRQERRRAQLLEARCDRADAQIQALLHQLEVWGEERNRLQQQLRRQQRLQHRNAALGLVGPVGISLSNPHPPPPDEASFTLTELDLAHTPRRKDSVSISSKPRMALV